MSVQPVNRNSHNVGFDLHQVIVEQVIPDKRLAICQEVSTKHRMEASLLPIRVREPMVGEVWLIDQTFGLWSFAALIRAVGSPEVTGDWSQGNEVAKSLLATLVQIGLVSDATTDGEAT